METSLTVTTQSVHIVPSGATGDKKSRLSRFARWQGTRPWFDLDLAAYRDNLLETLAPTSASAHLSTIRARYKAILRDPTVRDGLYTRAGERLAGMPGQADSVANRKAFVDEMETRLQNALDPKAAPVETLKSQDVADSAHVRLTSEQATALMLAPGMDTLRGLRDTALLSLLLCTGLREAEARALDVVDLRQRLGGELAVHVRKGKGCKERLVPWGALSSALAIVERWLEAAGIERGPIFRGIRKGDTIGSGRIGLRSIQRAVGRHPVAIDGAVTTVRAHDLRRTYARRLWAAGVDILAISQNLGHASLATTRLYIGILDADVRRPPAIYPGMGALLRQGTLL